MDYRKTAKEACANIAEPTIPALIETLCDDAASLDRDMVLLLIGKAWVIHARDNASTEQAVMVFNSPLTGRMWHNLKGILEKMDRLGWVVTEQLIQDWVDGNEIILD